MIRMPEKSTFLSLQDGVGAIEVTRVVEKYIKTKSEQLSATINASFEREFSQKNICM